MNERIGELAKEHGFVRWDYDSLSYELKGDIEDLYTFAELIVRECVSKCEFVADMATITNTGEMARKTKATADSCATMIKQHFGVE